MYFIISLAVVLLLFFLYWNRKPRKLTVQISPEITRDILLSKVTYFQTLDVEQQDRFVREALQFLQQVRVTGVKTEVTAEDSILVAASAIIPIFAFPGWQYQNLHEVLLYPDTFNEQFDFSKENPERQVLGMVGSGAMNHVMILSKPSLQEGFENKTDKNNTAIHEFIHLIDKTDGKMDGAPEILLDKTYVKPWLQLIHKNITSIINDESDINPYAATNEAEFFAVAAEYFFERPLLLEEKHPKLYALLETIFRQDPKTDSVKQKTKAPIV